MVHPQKKNLLKGQILVQVQLQTKRPEMTMAVGPHQNTASVGALGAWYPLCIATMLCTLCAVCVCLCVSVCVSVCVLVCV